MAGGNVARSAVRPIRPDVLDPNVPFRRTEIEIMKAVGGQSLASFLTALLNAAWYGTAILLGLSVCLLLISPLIDPPRLEVNFAVPAAITTDAANHPIRSTTPGLEHVSLQSVRGLVQFSPRSPAAVAAGALALIALFGIALWMVGQLRDIFRTLRDGQPFVAANATRLRHIGWAILLGEIARSGFDSYGNYYVMTHFTAAGLHFEIRPDVNVLPILAGLIVLAIAEVFRIGTRLDEDQALTV
jgi:hypothetical protein